MADKIDVMSCWCGSSDLEYYSSEYVRCRSCSTLINSPRYDNSFFKVTDEEESYYGKKYWLEHQLEDLGLHSVMDRTRLDLSGRCIHWLKCVLNYLSPKDVTLELGFGSGGLIALLDTLGYKSMGLELSEWLVDYVKNIYRINVKQGSIDDYEGEPKKFDSIMLFDVMEHLPDPLSTIQHISELITDEGYLFIQTPCFRNNDYSMNELVSKNDPFLSMMIDQEHLYLYTESSLKALLRKFGFEYFHMEQPLFEYDMFLVASKKSIVRNDYQKVEEILEGSREGRIILALIEVYNKQLAMEEQAVLRLQSIQKLESWLQESEKDRKDRLDSIVELEKKLVESEVDRKNRLNLINELQVRCQESEKDRDERLSLIRTLETLNSELSMQMKNSIELGNKEIYKIKENLKIVENELETKKQENEVIQNKYDKLMHAVSEHWLGRILFKRYIRD
ncbi:methyltransferase domain-containing protein [Paenibacillus sp. FSL W7-1332]|uniref:class I SAM-dependent methyltransferase n=1 Tax=Paenibacillus sp. FSL W7-1332 TaxID=2921702 RepID=UPI0030CEC571